MKQIKKSEIAGIPDFEAKVSAHAFELKNWRAHMQRVSDDEKNRVKIEDKHVAYKKPTSYRIVEDALNESGEPEFEIVDDGPTPAQILAAHKSRLLAQVSIAEHAAANAIWPINRRRLDSLREADINQAHIDKQIIIAGKRAETERGAIAKAILGPKYTNTVQEEAEAARPPADAAYLVDVAARRAKMSVLERSAAQAQSDIEDLTADNVDAWKLPEFSK